ncbi:MAG: DUF4859 domain-containing protein [Bacteroidales bacterium]|nr:DUF4859 domain-containing protein [Bacteroidales bacterium]
MKILDITKKISAFVLSGLLLSTSLTSCKDDDDDNTDADIPGEVTASVTTVTVEWNEVEACVPFNSTGTWNAAIEGNASETAWIKLTRPSGKPGDIRMPLLLTKNDNEVYREATVVVKSGTSSFKVLIHQNANPDAVKTMSSSSIEDFDKFYLPNSSNEGFEKGLDGMLRSDGRYSFFRFKQSEHFFVFWEPGFGDDPNSESLPKAMRVDVDDLLNKAELFFKTNVETLKMVTLGEGKSQLDHYKMEIFLLYQSEWLATGSGYDNKIGALWVNPSTCNPVGSTIAHEIGHSFQYMVFVDKLLNNEADETPVLQGSGYVNGEKYGFRYGFGEGGQGGCSYWEQCAQWQSFQDYPNAISEVTDLWLANYHRHFNHEYFRYQSVWFQYYLTMKHGIDAFGKLWQESEFPEDPLQTYIRLYCNNDLEKFWDNYYEYASHAVTYDFGTIQTSVPENAFNYKTKLYQVNGKFRPAYENCPEGSGFNVIRLNDVESGNTVKATLSALPLGSTLAENDPGNRYNDDNAVTSDHATTYNQHENNTSSYRFGFVVVDNSGKAYYSPAAKGKSGEISWQATASGKLYLVVVASPTTYARHAWNSDDSDDQQFPYEVSFTGTALRGYIDLPDGDPESTTISVAIDNLDASSSDWALGTIALDEGDKIINKIATAFKIQPYEIVGLLTNSPAEGKVAVGVTLSDGNLSYDYTANGYGFWVNSVGNNVDYSDGSIFIEYDGQYSISYGHKAGDSKQAGTSHVVRPTFVYTKNGTTYKAEIDITLNFK